MRYLALVAFVAIGCGSGQEPPPNASGDTCADVTCPGAQVCAEGEAGPTCACTVMAMCVDGHTWDEERCECVPVVTAGGACMTDSECRKEDNYCGGCHCLALGPGETGPTCDDPVQCFAQPCGVTAGEPACVEGRCTLVAG